MFVDGMALLLWCVFVQWCILAS